MSNNIKYEYYPLDLKEMFYIEYCIYSNQITWTLYKRHFFENPVVSDTPGDFIGSSNEGHPYNLYNGIVNEHEVIALNTKPYLEFMVDAMNLLYKTKTKNE